MTDDPHDRALAAADSTGLTYRLLTHGPVRSVAEAAAALGVEEADVVKTLVVRRGADDYVLVLVPGDRSLSWPRLRALLGVSRIALPDADEARSATGYERGTITPLGLGLPVVADARIAGRTITLGTGRHGVAIEIDASAWLPALGATLADVTEPA